MILCIFLVVYLFKFVLLSYISASVKVFPGAPTVISYLSASFEAFLSAEAVFFVSICLC